LFRFLSNVGPSFSRNLLRGAGSGIRKPCFGRFCELPEARRAHETVSLSEADPTLARDFLCRMCPARKGRSNRKQLSWMKQMRTPWEFIHSQRISRSTTEERTSRGKCRASHRSSDHLIFLRPTRTRLDIQKLGPEEAVYLILRIAKYYDVVSVKKQLKARLPEVDVWTQDEFGRRSKLYWISQTGAGAAILTAAVLAVPDWIGSRLTDDLRDHHGAFRRIRNSEGSRRLEKICDQRGSKPVVDVLRCRMRVWRLSATIPLCFRAARRAGITRLGGWCPSFLSLIIDVRAASLHVHSHGAFGEPARSFFVV